TNCLTLEAFGLLNSERISATCSSGSSMVILVIAIPIPYYENRASTMCHNSTHAEESHRRRTAPQYERDLETGSERRNVLDRESRRSRGGVKAPLPATAYSRTTLSRTLYCE